jgi:7-cyano-7-deazaguanine synthase in queuosine biosynthesis
MKKVLCLWSGGIDSTYMVWSYLKWGYEVDCCYVKLHNNVVKTKMEMEAIDKIYDHLKLFGNINKLNNTFDITLDAPGNAVIFKQMPIWINCLISSICKDHNEVAMGYIMNDDAISYLDDIKKVYDSYEPLFNWRYEDVKMPEIKFPLAKVHKSEIFTTIPIELGKLTVFCENPLEGNAGEFIPCGHCHTCSKRKFYEEQGNVPDELKVFKHLDCKEEDVCVVEKLSYDNEILWRQF